MIRTFIYGSCVSRDTFEFMRPQGYELVEYVARQSLISAYSELDIADMPEINTSSPFQRRMIEGDWSGSLVARLGHHRDDIDLVLWDLCDERLGVWRLATGHFVTRSVDGMSSGLDAAVAPTAERFTLGDQQHRQWFEDRLAHFRQTLKDHDLHAKTVMLAPAWATHREDGEPSPSSFGLRAEDANPVYEDYYRAVEEIVGIPMFRLPPSEVVGDADHRWGSAPFHYAEGVYQTLTSRTHEFAQYMRAGVTERG